MNRFAANTATPPSADACIVVRDDGTFLGRTATWHTQYGSAQVFPDSKLASKAVIVASRVGPTVADIVTVADYKSGRYAASVAAREVA